MFSSISFCQGPSKLSFSKTSIKQLWNLLIPCSSARQPASSLGSCKPSLQPLLQVQVRLSPSISILLLIQKLLSDHRQEQKRTWHHCPGTLKRLGVLPKVLHFIGFEHLTQTLAIQVIKRGQIFFFNKICTSHTEIFISPWNFPDCQAGLLQVSQLGLKEGIENGAGIGGFRVGDRDSCLFQGAALLVSRDLTGKSKTCVLKMV